MKTAYVPFEEKTHECGRASPPKPIKPHQWERIAKALRIGMNLQDAADLAKISYGRLYRNIEADKHLSKEVRHLFATCKEHHVQKIYDGERGWQASAWFLERMFRKEYALHLPDASDEEKAIQMRKIIRKKGVPPGRLQPVSDN
jgi:hypothetical protein